MTADDPPDSGTTGSVPDFRAARQHVLTELLRFVADLRSDGVSVPASGALDAARALAVVGLDDEDAVAAALRATLLSETSDADAFEDAFPAFWQRLRSGLSRIATAGESPGGERSGGNGGAVRGEEERRDDGDRDENTGDGSGEPDRLEDAKPPESEEDAGDEAGGDEPEPEVLIPTGERHTSGDEESASGGEDDARRYSAVGGSELVDAENPSLSGGELAAIDRFVDALATLPGRRRRRSSSGSALDARRALRASLQTGGAPIALPETAPVASELRVCLLVDVSGSVLDTVDRSALLALAERLVAAARDPRVFLFDTDVVEATASFRAADGAPADALRAAEVRWGGGTRIGHALDEIRATAPHAVDRRTVVVVVSDGLDVGDADTLEAGVAWLADRADGVVWLNPLAVSPSYEPTARGMATAAPHVDALFGFARASDLAAAARQLERRGLAGPVGYQYDRLTGDGPGVGVRD
ncbi:MAG: VWA domain-containing protein [Halobacterium sp.]